MALGKLDSHMQKNTTGPPSYIKINSKLFKDLHIRPVTVKLLEKKNRGKLLLEMIPNHKQQKQQ